MRRILPILGFTAGMSLASAQPLSLSGPVEGFTFDAPTRTVRAIQGVPGSAYFGPALLRGLDYASAAPRRSYAITFKAGKCFLVSGLGSTQISSTAIRNVAGSPDGLVWSGDGSQALLYSRSGAWMQTLEGLPNAPQAGGRVDLAVLGGSLSALATDTQGKQIAVAVSGPNAGVYLSTGSQSLIPVLRLSDPVALAFSDDAATLYALDGASAQLSAVTLANFSSRTFALQGLRDPFAIGFGRDASGLPVIYAAGRGERFLEVYSLQSGGSPTRIVLAFQPTGLEAFGPASFVIAARMKPDDPLWLFSTAPRPAAYFVPALTHTLGGHQ